MIKKILRLATGGLRNVFHSPQFMHTKSLSQKMICQIINKTRFYFSQVNTANDQKMLRHWHAMEEVLHQKQFYVSSSEISPSQNIKDLTEQQLQMLIQITQNKKTNDFKNPSQEERNFIKDKLNPDMAKIIKEINKRAEDFYLKKLSKDQQKMTSLWQIKKLFEKSFLWNLKFKSQNQNLKAFADYFLIQYTPYLLKLITIITSNGEVGVSQSKYTLNQEMPMSLRQIILEQLKLIKSELDKREQAHSDVNSYFFQCFESLFKIGQNSYWEYCLLNQQVRFSQTTKRGQSDDKQRIIFTPTVYTSQVFRRIFDDKIPREASSYRMQYRNVNYFMGQKYNGKSHSIALSRIIFGHFTNFIALSISTFQGKTQEIQNFVNLLGNIISRDLWYHLDKVNIEKLNNVKMKFDQQKFIPNIQYPRLGMNPIITFAKNFLESKDSKINQENIQKKFIENWCSINNGLQYLKLKELISILKSKSLKLQYLIIDQFNYFGRELYKLQNIQSIADQNIAKMIQKTFLASQLYKVNPNIRVKLFASTNNYQYQKLFQAIFGQYFKEHNLTGVRSYLFSETQVVNQVHFHLSQYYYFDLKKKQAQKQREIYSKIFLDKKKLKDFCSQIPYGLSLKDCQTFSKSIINNFKIHSTQFFKNEKEQKIIIEDIFNSSIQEIKQVVKNKVYKQLQLHISQNCANKSQAQEMLGNMITLHTNQKFILRLKDMLSKQSKKTYYSFFQVFIPLNKNIEAFNDVNVKLHKGYQEFCNYFANKERFQKLINNLNQKKKDFDIEKKLMKLIIQHLNQLKSQNKIDQLQAEIKSLQTRYGNQFQGILFEFFENHSKKKKKSLKFMFQLNGNKFQFQFDKVVVEKDDNSKFSQNIIEKAKEATKQLNTLTVIKMHQTNQGCDFELFFKVKNKESEEETAYMIALEAKTGKKLNATKILKNYLKYKPKSKNILYEAIKINQKNIQTLIDNKFQFIFAVCHSRQKLKINKDDDDYIDRLTCFKTSDAFPQIQQLLLDDYRNALFDFRKYIQQYKKNKSKKGRGKQKTTQN